jgi:hypothetical protein
VDVELLCQYSISGLSVYQSIAKYMHNEACSSAMRIRLLHARTILWEGVDARAVRLLTALSAQPMLFWSGAVLGVAYSQVAKK